MILPEEIVLKLFDSVGEKIQNLIVYVEILAPRKNNYTLGPFLSDALGEVRIDRQSILNTVSNNLRAYPMDYCSTIEQCKDELNISIPSIKTVEKRMMVVREFYPEVANELSAYLKIATNTDAVDVQVQHIVSPQISVVVSKSSLSS